MSGHKLIRSVIATWILALSQAAFAAGGSLPLSGGGGSLPLRTTGTAVTLDAAEVAVELKTEVTIAMVDDAAETEALACDAETKAQPASGVLKISDKAYTIQAICFQEDTQALKVLAVADNDDEATLKAVIDVTAEGRRSLKGRLTLKKDSSGARRFLMETAEVLQTLPTPE